MPAKERPMQFRERPRKSNVPGRGRSPSRLWTRNRHSAANDRHVKLAEAERRLRMPQRSGASPERLADPPHLSAAAIFALQRT